MQGGLWSEQSVYITSPHHQKFDHPTTLLLVTCSHDGACMPCCNRSLSSTHAGATFVHAGKRLQTVHGGTRPQRAKQKEHVFMVALATTTHTHTQEAPERHTFPNGNHNHTPALARSHATVSRIECQIGKPTRKRERERDAVAIGVRACTQGLRERALCGDRKWAAHGDETLHAATASHSPLLLCRR